MKSTEKNKYLIPQDVIMFFNEEGNIVLFNVFCRTYVEINNWSMDVLTFLTKPHTKKEFVDFAKNEHKKISTSDLTYFSCVEHGLSGDPSNFIRGEKKNNQVNAIADACHVFDLLKERFIIVSDPDRYREYFTLKRDIFDKERLGNFHQQLGQELMLKTRMKPDLWWLKQKFNDSCKDINNNLYKFIQLEFYKKFFTKTKVRNKRILDVGCGPGFYSNFLASLGANVIGIDPNPEYIKIANTNSSNKNVRFRVSDIGSGRDLEHLKSNYFDIIIFQDALLFYFIPHDNIKLDTITKVLSELKRALKPNGLFYVTEPHGVFQFSPWLGEIDRPFTVLTEYRNKIYGITPNLSQITEEFYKVGLQIKRILEPDVSSEALSYDKRGYYFGRNFPQWWIFELTKNN
jgi:SAM-dependent methyltransferase